MRNYKFCRIMTAFLFALGILTSAFSYAGERVLVVGDSITGHSMNLPYGFANEVRAALTDAQSDVEFVPLGGSGQTIFSWRGIIANSYENNQQLDIKGIFVKDEFDKGADTLLVHLGMNDALCPSIPQTQEGYDSWRAEYKLLIDDLRKRVPGVKRIILTPPTMLTENPYAFKNVFMDALSEIVKETAAENDCEFFDVRSEFRRHFLAARIADPNIRFTLDFVHPNQYGHQVMAWSFLKSLGLNEIADRYYQEKVDPAIKDFDAKGFYFFVNDVRSRQNCRSQGSTESLTVPIEISGAVNGIDPTELKIVSCGDLSVYARRSNGDGEFTFYLEGKTSSLPTDVVIQADDVVRTAHINAPYFVATGFPFESYPKPEEFPRDKAVTEIDRIVLSGQDPLETTITLPGEQKPLLWYYYYPTPDKTGAENPNAVDIADLPPANAFDAAYVVRCVYSPKAQEATLKLNSEGFSTTAIETIYLNGKEIYFDCLSPRHIKAVDSLKVELKEGLNILVSRVDHTNWQWGTSFSFEDAEGLSF